MKGMDSPIIFIGAWRIDSTLDEISKDGSTVKLERRAMQLLMHLAERPGEVVSVEQLLDQVWTGVVVTPDSVYHAVASLRRLLGDDSREPTYIANVPRRGYRLVAPVSTPVAGPLETVEAAASAAEPAHKVPIAASVRRLSLRHGAVALLCIAFLTALGYVVIDKFWRSSSVTAQPRVIGAAASLTENSIAVLPFVDMSEEKDQEYFSDGLSEELIGMLAKVPNLRVPARTSSFYFKGQHTTITQIGEALRVRNVLEGSVRKAGDTIRVTAQLIQVDNDHHLWSETYDRELKDVFKVQDEIAGAVVAALKLKLSPERPVLASHRTLSPEAYDEYLLARQFEERANLDGIRLATEAYRKAITLDPNYAAAYARLAMAEFYLTEKYEDILAFADKAIELAPDQADGYASRGFVRLKVNWDWHGAQADFDRALALNSRDSSALQGHAELLDVFGRLPEAIEVAKKATDLDPLSTPAWMTLGLYLMNDHQYTAAHEALRRAIELQPKSDSSVWFLAELQLLQGRAAEALPKFRWEDDEGTQLWGVAASEHTLGHAKESEKALEDLITQHAHDLAYYIATVYAWRGEKDKAFEWLARAYKQHESDLSYIKDDPMLTSLHGEPRFAAMLRKLNLPE
jgi:TolB-like protein/DNA-binding winged helix-turn-helix (wHTH) protein/Tfp pilus assembly protein PilF